MMSTCTYVYLFCVYMYLNQLQRKILQNAVLFLRLGGNMRLLVALMAVCATAEAGAFYDLSHLTKEMKDLIDTTKHLKAG